MNRSLNKEEPDGQASPNKQDSVVRSAPKHHRQPRQPRSGSQYHHESQDVQDGAFSQYSSRAHPSTPSAGPSRATDQGQPGDRGSHYHSGQNPQAESRPQGGPHHYNESYPNTESQHQSASHPYSGSPQTEESHHSSRHPHHRGQSHLGGPHHPREDVPGMSNNQSESSPHGKAHSSSTSRRGQSHHHQNDSFSHEEGGGPSQKGLHGESHHHQSHRQGRSHQHDSHQSQRHLQHGESLSFMGSHPRGGPHARGDRSYGGHRSSDHRDHHHREYHHREHSRGISQLSVPSRSVVGDLGSHLRAKSSPFSTSHSMVRSSRTSTKIYPEDAPRESEIWTDDEQQFRKHKSRSQRAHKKLHSGNFFQWCWEKILVLFGGLRQMMKDLTQSLIFETFIFLVVLLNTVMLVAQTFAKVEIRGEWYFMVLDLIFLCIYVLEALLKQIALGVEYFYDFWNNLDFLIMVMAVVDFALLQIYSLSYSFYNQSLFRILKVFKSMRALRAIRVLRRLSILTSLHEVTGTLSGSLPSIFAILTLMFTCLFLFSVVLRALFRKSDPKRFQNIFTTLFTLFTMLTLDDWSLIYMDSRAKGAWYIIPILMVYIIIQYFIFLNLVIAVLVDNFQMALLKALEKEKQEKAARVHEKLLEDSFTALNQAEVEAMLTEDALNTQFIERKFGALTEKQRELHFQFLQLVASVEQHQQKFRSQASVIDEIVDTAFEAGEEDFGK